MTRYSPSPREAPGAAGRRLPWGSMTLAGLALWGVWIVASPPNSFHPTCTYSVNAVVSSEVEVAGDVLSAEVVHQDSHSRPWISLMNSAGCKQRYGNALVFRLANGNVLIVSAQLCRAAKNEYAASGHADMLHACVGGPADKVRAFIVESATQPDKWRPATAGVDFRILSMTATSTWRAPTDDIASIAPNLLKAYFERDPSRGMTWGMTPETLIDYARRSDIKKQRPDKSFEFEVRYEDF